MAIRALISRVMLSMRKPVSVKQTLLKARVSLYRTRGRAVTGDALALFSGPRIGSLCMTRIAFRMSGKSLARARHLVTGGAFDFAAARHRKSHVRFVLFAVETSVETVPRWKCLYRRSGRLHILVTVRTDRQRLRSKLSHMTLYAGTMRRKFRCCSFWIFALMTFTTTGGFVLRGIVREIPVIDGLRLCSIPG